MPKIFNSRQKANKFQDYENSLKSYPALAGGVLFTNNLKLKT